MNFKAFEDGYNERIVEHIKMSARADAPNYRKAKSGDNCGNCKHETASQCMKYNFHVDKHWTCDAWKGK